MKKYLFTSESVTEGHPDKLCDSISDSILDACLEQDKNARVAIETFASQNKIWIAGQMTTTAKINVEEITRNRIKEIGYNNQETDMDYRTCEIEIKINKQSMDISIGVDAGGAGDQGIMFGYACDETEEFMPLAIYIAHRLSERLTYVRKQGILQYLRPDGKTQVTVEYEDDKPKRIDTILISNQHLENTKLDQMKQDLIKQVIEPVVDKKYIDKNTKIYINPTGRFVIGGPLGDTGLTGRKIIVDTYGGYSRHGGGAFSGKDPSKVDRTATYMLRHIAKNIVANGLAKKCEIEIAYGIGMIEPISICVDTFGTGTKTEEELIEIIKRNFDLTPNGMINYLNLKQPIYAKTTNYEKKRKKGLTWENVIKLI